MTLGSAVSLFVCFVLFLPSLHTSLAVEDSLRVQTPSTALLSQSRHVRDADPEGNDTSTEPTIADTFSILGRDRNTSCLYITDEAHIPPQEHGTQTYGEECDPFPGGPRKCKRYVKAFQESFAAWCYKATHLVCDYTSRRCMCSRDNVILAPIRFQFGNDTAKTLEGGRCLVRPTFDIIEGIDCSPGTKPVSVIVDNDFDAEMFCGCQYDDDSDAEKFTSSDPDWWTCGRAGELLSSSALIILLCFSVCRWIFE